MSPFLSLTVTVTLACYTVAMVLACVRLLRGPAAQDRVLALDCLYVDAALVVLVLGVRHASSITFEVALLIALLGFVSSAALAKFLLRGEMIE